MAVSLPGRKEVDRAIFAWASEPGAKMVRGALVRDLTPESIRRFWANDHQLKFGPLERFLEGMKRAFWDDDRARTTVRETWRSRRRTVRSAVQTAFGWWGMERADEAWSWLATRFQPTLVEVADALSESEWELTSVEVPETWRREGADFLVPSDRRSPARLLAEINGNLPETALELLGFYPSRYDIPGDALACIRSSDYAAGADHLCGVLPHLEALCRLFAGDITGTWELIEGIEPLDELQTAQKLGLQAVCLLESGESDRAEVLLEERVPKAIQREELIEWPTWALLKGLAKWGRTRRADSAVAFLEEDGRFTRARAVFPVRLALGVLDATGSSVPGILRKLGRRKELSHGNRKQAAQVLRRLGQRGQLGKSAGKDWEDRLNSDGMVERPGATESSVQGQETSGGERCAADEAPHRESDEEAGDSLNSSDIEGLVSLAGEEDEIVAFAEAVERVWETHDAYEQETREGDLSNFEELSADVVRSQEAVRERLAVLESEDLPPTTRQLGRLSGIWDLEDIERALDELRSWLRERRRARREATDQAREGLRQEFRERGMVAPDAIETAETAEHLEEIHRANLPAFRGYDLAEAIVDGETSVDALADRLDDLGDEAFEEFETHWGDFLEGASSVEEALEVLARADGGRWGTKVGKQLVVQTVETVVLAAQELGEAIWALVAEAAARDAEFFDRNDLVATLDSVSLGQIDLGALHRHLEGAELAEPLEQRRRLGEALEASPDRRIELLTDLRGTPGFEDRFILSRLFDALVEGKRFGEAFYLASLAAQRGGLDVSSERLEELALCVIFKRLREGGDSLGSTSMMEHLIRPEWLRCSVTTVLALWILGLMNRSESSGAVETYFYTRRRWQSGIERARKEFPVLTRRLEHLLESRPSEGVGWREFGEICADARQTLEALNRDLEKTQIMGGWEQCQRLFCREVRQARDRLLGGESLPSIDVGGLLQKARDIRDKAPGPDEKAAMRRQIEQQKERLERLETLLEQAGLLEERETLEFLRSDGALESELEQLVEDSDYGLAMSAMAEYLREEGDG